MNRGFFVFEGVEGSGKTTLITSLQKALTLKSLTTIQTREPGATDFGAKIRALLLHETTAERSALAELLLFYADRAQHIKEVILPALENNSVVLCDRFFYSTIAYQCYGRGINRSIVDTLNSLVVGDLLPTGVILLDIDPEISFERVKSRGALDVFEKEHIDFHRKIRAGYLALASEFPENFLVLDASQPPEVLFSHSLSYIIHKLEEK